MLLSRCAEPDGTRRLPGRGVPRLPCLQELPHPGSWGADKPEHSCLQLEPERACSQARPSLGFHAGGWGPPRLIPGMKPAVAPSAELCGGRALGHAWFLEGHTTVGPAGLCRAFPGRVRQAGAQGSGVLAGGWEGASAPELGGLRGGRGWSCRHLALFVIIQAVAGF